jgi:hypothetical protein
MTAFKKFWMVWCPSRGNPSKKHGLEADAREEAHRLAEENPGYEFFVLLSVGSWMIRQPEPTWGKAVER